MIELPEVFKVMLDRNPRNPYPTEMVRADACHTYGDQRAAEAREQMRDECVKEITQLTTIYTDKTAGFDLGYTKASNLAVKLIKGLK